MKFKSVLCTMLAVVAFVGFVSVGITHAALGFDDWQGVWFEVKSSETGKSGPVVPLPGSVETNNEKTSITYLLVDTWDLTTTTYGVVYCTFDGSVWTRQTTTAPGGIDPLQLEVLGGQPEDFLTFFNIAYQETPAILQTYWIPIEITGKEDNKNPGVIKSAQFKNLGGIFTEASAGERGVGSVKFTGKFIASDKVVDKFPPGCRIP